MVIKKTRCKTPTQQQKCQTYIQTHSNIHVNNYKQIHTNFQIFHALYNIIGIIYNHNIKDKNYNIYILNMCISAKYYNIKCMKYSNSTNIFQ